SRAEYPDELFLPDLGHEQVAAQIENVAVTQAIQRYVGGTELCIGAKGVDEASVLAGDIDDQRLTSGSTRSGGNGGHVDSLFLEELSDDSAKDVVTDAANDGRGNSHFGKINGGIGRAATEGQEQFIGHHQLSGRRQVRDRRTHVIRNDNAGTKHIRLLAH